MAAFDEMGIASGETRPLYRQVAQWLDETPPELLASRRAQAEYMFRRIGITFGVYGDKDAAERLIPFDIVPRLISRAEWRTLEAGLSQRAHALNLFLKDVYGRAGHSQGIDHSARTDCAQSLLSAGDDRPARAP